MSLASWNDGAARSAILDFIARVTEEGGTEYVPPAERIAVLDNDGTLWCERPAYVQAIFVFGRLGEAAASRPDLAGQPVVKALLTGGPAASHEYGIDAIAGMLLELDAGRTTEEFTGDAERWLAAAEHPRFHVPFRELTFAPMLELMEVLRFRVFIVTGGGVEPEQHTGDHPSFCLVVDHDDDEREYAYAGASASDPETEPILETASRIGWTVVSMRRDWNRVFAG